MPATARILVSRTRPLVHDHFPEAALITFRKDGVERIKHVWGTAERADGEAGPMDSNVAHPIAGFDGLAVEWLMRYDSTLVRNEGAAWFDHGIITTPEIDNTRPDRIDIRTDVVIALGIPYPVFWLRGRLWVAGDGGDPFTTYPLVLSMPEGLLRRRRGDA